MGGFESGPAAQMAREGVGGVIVGRAGLTGGVYDGLVTMRALRNPVSAEHYSWTEMEGGGRGLMKRGCRLNAASAREGLELRRQVVRCTGSRMAFEFVGVDTACVVLYVNIIVFDGVR